MPKYDSLISDLNAQMASARRVLIALPVQFSVDKLAAALALALSIKNTGKEVAVVTEGTPTVAHTNLFGVGEVKNQVPTTGDGNFIIKLDGVVDTTGQLNTVPSLEKLDWHPEGSSLNLVFHVVPGQRFEPTNVSHYHEGSNFDLVFSVGAASKEELGSLYNQFGKASVVNIDNSSSNSQFGNINIVDSNAAAVSEVVAHLMPSITLTLDPDSASNILAGIYEATANLTQNVGQDTHTAAANATQAGGKPPVVPTQTADTQMPTAQPFSVQSSMTFNQPLNPQPAPMAAAPEPMPQPQITPIPTNTTPVQPDAAPPATDLMNNPFLNPNQAIISGPGFNSTPQNPSPAPFAQATPYPSQPAQNAQPQPSFAPQPQSMPFQVAPQPTPVAAPSSEPIPQQPVQIQPQEQVQMPVIPQTQPGDTTYDLRQIFQIPQMPEEPGRSNTNPNPAGLPTDNFKRPPVQTPPQPPAQDAKPQVQSSPEELPMKEMTGSYSPEMDSNPTPDWLVPKIFKSGSLG
jgi:nanoRNase/pAp phosphatase (c-di-AMP/oligoRNAs hydrolase)